jgi:short-subunit dehydrogenase
MQDQRDNAMLESLTLDLCITNTVSQIDQIQFDVELLIPEAGFATYSSKSEAPDIEHNTQLPETRRLT